MNSSLLGVKFENVSRVFRPDIFHAAQVGVENLTLSFEAGKCTGLVGSNGAGKTTTMRLMLGIIRPTRGKILFNDRKLCNDDYRAIGYMPEINKLPSRLTALEIIGLHSSLYRLKLRKKTIIKHLVEAGLDERHHTKLIYKYSKGMARRLAWILATIHKPKFLVLDEPFSGLDPLGQKEMIAWISQLRSSKTTIILSSHHLENLVETCDHVHLIERGQHLETVDMNQSYQPVFSLQISLNPGQNIAKLQHEFGLPSYSDSVQQGFLQTLHFLQYDDSVAWTQFCLQEGIVVLRYEHQGHLPISSLYKKLTNRMGVSA